MIELITGLPDNVLGLRAGGTLTAEDYDQIVTPVVENRLSRFPKLRLLCVIQDDFAGLSAGAAWRDAKLGMKHFTAFERVAVVTGKDWVDTVMRVFGFLIPGEAETFRPDQFETAKAWVLEPPAPGKLKFSLDEQSGILVLEPQGELQSGDFARVAAEVDPFIAEKGRLAGLVIVAESFPGWDSFSAMMAHFRFVREHVDKVRRVALVTSDQFLSALPRLASHFVAAEVRRFPLDQRDAALAWVGAAAGSTMAS